MTRAMFRAFASPRDTFRSFRVLRNHPVREVRCTI